MTHNNGRKIGIINSGGDCAGLNAVIASIVKTGAPLGYSFVGFEKGWEGLLDPMKYIELTTDNVRGISHIGGTILHTTNRGRFAGKVGESIEVHAIPPEILEMAKQNLDSIGVEGLIVIGGDGTLAAAMQLADYGVNIIGVPKSIDNDLAGTDRTFGFNSAISVAVDAFDKIHTTSTSHSRLFLVECMGRHAGWITLHAGIAGNANAILLPEFDLNIDELIEFLKERMQSRGSSIVAVAEGLKLGQQQNHIGIQSSESRMQGAANSLLQAIEARAPELFEIRTVVLGHTQRGGAPVASDRLLAKRFGVAAVDAYESGNFGTMVSLQDKSINLIPIREATGSLRLVTHDDPYYVVAQKLGVYMN